MKEIEKLNGKVNELEIKVFKLESEKFALENSLAKMQDSLVDHKEDGEGLQKQLQNTNEQLVNLMDTIKHKN